jgi:hypothetical protein
VGASKTHEDLVMNIVAKMLNIVKNLPQPYRAVAISLLLYMAVMMKVK